jgi:hypothetical protein
MPFRKLPYTASDGWFYIMEPKVVHINDDTGDLTYKFFFDEFEARGINFPDAKLGTELSRHFHVPGLNNENGNIYLFNLTSMSMSSGIILISGQITYIIL